MRVPKRYIPKILTRKDVRKQKTNIIKSRKLYQKGVYYQRPKVSSFHSKPSKHVTLAEQIYNVKSIQPNKELSKKTGCSQKALEKIVNKGRGAYYSSGSRPNQTAESWGIARLASAITGGKSSVIDYNILENGCHPNSKALKLAKKTRKNVTRKSMKQHSPKVVL
jgi:Family of unknown function (DUF5824)